MFKIFTKNLNIHELRTICELWHQMVSFFLCKCRKDCDNCKHKRLCGALYSTERYLEKELRKRESDDSKG